MKEYIKYIVLFIIVFLFACIMGLYDANKTLNSQLALLSNNQKAYINENSILKNDNKVFKFTVDLLEYYNDSILLKLNSVRQELNIKDKNLHTLLYLLSLSSKRDTVVFRDTLFKEPELCLDTVIGDKWYTLNLGLRYPNKLIANPIFNNETYIVTSINKEYINPPKKWWIQRIFLRKHKVLKVLVIEKSPYVKLKQLRFVEIIK